MNNLKVTVDAKALNKWLALAPDKIKKATENIIYKSTLLVERYGKQFTPVDTGRLRASISSDIRPMSASVSTHTNYARYVHDGTRNQTARPFMAQAVTSVRSQMDDVIESEVKNALN